MNAIPVHKLAIVRVALAGAGSAALFYALCWIGMFLPIGPATHAYLRLFTGRELASGAALAEGILWSLAFGLIAGTLFTALYNAFARFERG